jgi:hypothetical protein
MEADKITGESRHPIELIVRPVLVDDQVLPLNESGLL